ncbi:hypothetical protein F4604DRAFT_1679336 [Suillus subluteus]|nr:hypothetical protein F4604DRAFT_1679336 [Suillus subluteus]
MAVSQPHHAFRTVVQTFVKYRRGDVRITLSEAMSEDVFDVVTSSPMTGDMIFMTPGGVAAFYPDLTFEGVVILNSTLKDRPPGNYVGCMKHARYDVHDSTHFLEEPCGRVCPALWHNIMDGGPGSLVLEWDLRYSIRSTMARSHTSWRLAEHCYNGHCPLNPVFNARLPQLPVVPAPADQWAVREQEARMHHYNSISASADYHTHILYATRACAPEIVPIPLQDGHTQLEHINNLEVLHWVDCLGDNKFNVNMARVRKTHNVIALALSPACRYGYTFFREHPAVFAPPNALIADITGDVCMENAVMGNVLVVKHINGNKHKIVSLTIADLDCINEVLIRLVSHIRQLVTVHKPRVWHGPIGSVTLKLLDGRHNDHGHGQTAAIGFDECDTIGLVTMWPALEGSGQTQMSNPHSQSGGGSPACNASCGFRKIGEGSNEPPLATVAAHDEMLMQ